MMIGIVSDIVEKHELDIELRIITAATWKNQVNRVYSLERLYSFCQSRGCVDHKLDSALMSLYGAAVEDNPYLFLANKKIRNLFLKQLFAAL